MLGSALAVRIDQIFLEKSTNALVKKAGKILSHRVRVSRWPVINS
jgi:hypothetical protein